MNTRPSGERARLPFLIRLFNGISRHSPPHSRNAIQPCNLLAAARRQTGLHDLGAFENEMMEALGTLTHSLETEAELSPMGRIIARKHLIDLLATRLHVQASRTRAKSDPAEIRPPLIITGLPRSGSSFLQALLSQDPASRAPLVWETMSRRFRRKAKERRRAIISAQRQLRGFHWLLPDLRTMHELEAEMPQECIAIMGLSFASPVFSDFYWIPGYRRSLDLSPLHTAYYWHRTYLERLQGDLPADFWILKAPEHLARIDELLRIYPNAMIVQTHREPLQVLGSVASLTATLRRATSDRHDPHAIGKEVTDLSREALEKGIAAREALNDEKRFLDVYFQDIAQSPIDTAARIYDYFGLPMTKVAKEAMRRFVNERPRDRRPRHIYSLEAFGVDPAEASPKFNAYRKRFGLPPGADPSDCQSISPTCAT